MISFCLTKLCAETGLPAAHLLNWLDNNTLCEGLSELTGTHLINSEPVTHSNTNTVHGTIKLR